MDMPKIASCDVGECAYNHDKMCHALAITVGDGENPRCDTFCQTDMKGGDTSATGRVGACKVSVCKFNKSLECGAKSIKVAHKGGDVDCMTFSRR